MKGDVNAGDVGRDPTCDTLTRICALLDRLGVDAGDDPVATASAFLDAHEPELAERESTPDQLLAQLAVARERIAELEAELAAQRDASAAVLAAARAEAAVIRRDALVTAEGLRRIAAEDARELRERERDSGVRVRP